MLILDLKGVPFHAVVVSTMGYEFLFEFILGRCVSHVHVQCCRSYTAQWCEINFECSFFFVIQLRFYETFFDLCNFRKMNVHTN